MFLQHVDTFVYELGLAEKNLEKRAMIDALTLTDVEWSRVGDFIEILEVRLSPCLSLRY
jgi:hypothetical protein